MAFVNLSTAGRSARRWEPRARSFRWRPPALPWRCSFDPTGGGVGERRLEAQEEGVRWEPW